jgi:hypothetical protein
MVKDFGNTDNSSSSLRSNYSISLDPLSRRQSKADGMDIQRSKKSINKSWNKSQWIPCSQRYGARNIFPVEILQGMHNYQLDLQMKLQHPAELSHQVRKRPHTHGFCH